MASLQTDNDVATLRDWVCTQGKTFTHSKFTPASVTNQSLLVKGSDDDSIKALSEECLKLDAAPTQSLANYRSIKEFILCLESALPESYKQSGAYFCPFGSSVTNFWTDQSDLDVSLVTPNHDAGAVSVLEELERGVKNQWSKFQAAGLESCTLVKEATVPILKFVSSKGKPFLDVSVNNTAGITNSHLVALFGLLDPRVPILGRLIKRWAQSRRINDRAEGTISSYTLLLCLFWFLQNRNPPVLPKYDTISKDAVKTRSNCEALCCTDNDWRVPFVVDTDFILNNLWSNKVKNEESVGKLLYEFFMFFGDEETIQKGVKLNLKDGTKSWTSSKEGTAAVCPTTDRIQTLHNESKLDLVSAEFKRARSVLQQTKSLKELFLERR